MNASTKFDPASSQDAKKSAKTIVDTLSFNKCEELLAALVDEMRGKSGQHATIKPARPSVAEALTAIVDAMRVINASGDLADAPTDLVNALDDGDTAARGLMEWLGKRVPQRPMPYGEWVA